MPVRTTSADATAKWLANISNSSARMQAGAMRVQTAPGQAAAAAADKWLAKVTAAKAKFAARLGSVSLLEGEPAYSNGGSPPVCCGAEGKVGQVTPVSDPIPF